MNQTETSDLEQQLAHLSSELQRRDLLVGTTAHSMRSSISVLTGYLKLLTNEQVGSLSATQRACLQDMEATSIRLDQLVSELLTYSFLEAGGRLAFAVGDLATCLHAVYRDWRIPYQNKGVHLDFSPQPGIRQFPFEYERISRVVACLLDNALKFTPAGKSVRLTLEPHFWERRRERDPVLVERRKRPANTGPNSVLIRVIDTGAGIAPEYQQEIFEQFYTVACGEAKPGTGLGLAIARQVVQTHGGKIWVESSVGEGSRFCIVLPYGRPTTVPVESVPRAASCGA